MNTNSNSNAVNNPPRLVGLKKPSRANVIVARVMVSTWHPVPHNTESSMGENLGGRNTSAWTSFHPVSSWSSAISLYAAMSRCNVRSMIIATIPVKNTTIIREFTMENQCT
mmetsp:Transcript_12156/g.24142  ORF Transcript_12156/g.24142 Transcript_12156/m.24142 type:complete len:111 (-) Transcript_12156:824-1156(-)